jgi:A/G-specific adenine glycosylase
MTTTTKAFQTTIWEYYRTYGRHDLPWRQPEPDGSFSPYKIMVSEIMLQQTQVPRVIPKYIAFLEQFPTVQALAIAPLADVLTAWSGLGYNRRAKFLWQSAHMVTDRYQGIFPKTHKELVALPGIGPNTAGAILAYAYDTPMVFIETNIRTVFIHHFFADQQAVSDAALLSIIEDSLPPTNTREWYWALMDYGTHLKQTVGNVSRASSSYSRQSAFHGSRRQVRGQVLRLLTDRPRSLNELSDLISDERLPAVLQDLAREKLIQQDAAVYRLYML